MEYAEAKKILKGKQIKFQTPYPARLRVFYNDGTRLYQTAEEATEDMAKQGFPITVVLAQTNPDSREIRLLSSWKMAEERGAGLGAPNSTDN